MTGTPPPELDVRLSRMHHHLTDASRFCTNTWHLGVAHRLPWNILHLSPHLFTRPRQPTCFPMSTIEPSNHITTLNVRHARSRMASTGRCTQRSKEQRGKEKRREKRVADRTGRDGTGPDRAFNTSPYFCNFNLGGHASLSRVHGYRVWKCIWQCFGCRSYRSESCCRHGPPRSLNKTSNIT